jgi:lipopolysaccharide export LptBFGC system permease protein LptF
MQKLPARRKSNYAYLVIAFAAGMLAFLWQMVSTPLFQQGWYELAQGQFTPTVLIVCAILFGVSLLVSAWILTEKE